MFWMIIVGIEGRSIGKYGDQSCVERAFKVQNVLSDIEALRVLDNSG
jgi:hypothetical protein